MLPRAILLSIALLSVVPAVLAADPIVPGPGAAATATQVSPQIYIEALGGVSLPGKLEFFHPAPNGVGELEVGAAFAGVVGLTTGIDGLAAEFDVFYTGRDYTMLPPNLDGTTTMTTIMGDLKYTVDLTDTLSLYGAAGLGVLRLQDSDSTGPFTDGWKAGYVLKVGAATAIANNLSLIGEVRYMDSFEYFEAISPTDDRSRAATSAALIGLRFGL